MNENHQDTANSNLTTTESKIWLPPSYLNNKSPVVSPVAKKKGINWGFADRTVFDWSMLLCQVLGAIAIPFVVLVIGLYATQQITQQQIWSSQRQHQIDLQIAKDNRQNDLQIVADQQRETTLKTYLDDMSDLLLNHHLRQSKSGDEVSQVARERTLTTLSRLDGKRNQIVLQFLQDAHLIGGKNAIINLSNTDLSKRDLSSSNLSGVDLSNDNFDKTNLGNANLSGADLASAFLSNAYLSSAQLDHTNLKGAELGPNLVDINLDYADLSGDYLHQADLNGANLSGANLEKVDLSNASLNQANLTHANLRGANLRFADLARAHLDSANLSGADLASAFLGGAGLSYSLLSDANLNGTFLGSAFLIEADLSNTKLNNTNLSYALLSGVHYLTQQQLDQVSTCKGALLPKGVTCHNNQ